MHLYASNTHVQTSMCCFKIITLADNIVNNKEAFGESFVFSVYFLMNIAPIPTSGQVTRDDHIQAFRCKQALLFRFVTNKIVDKIDKSAINKKMFVGNFCYIPFQ